MKTEERVNGMAAYMTAEGRVNHHQERRGRVGEI